MALEQSMNCFDWQNYSSDYLDGDLPESLKKEADKHLASCKECSERNEHYRTILSSIGSLPQTSLPPPLRKAPLQAAIPRAETARIALSHWEQVPWYLRTIFEAFGIILLISLGISSAPFVRSVYEKSIEKSLSQFRENFTVTESVPQTNEPVFPSIQSGPAVTAQNQAAEEELNGEDESEEKIKVGKSELWRFTLKTVSPDEVRPQVVKVLTELNIPMSTPGLGGMQVPGGIEFDLILPQSDVPNIKRALQKLAPKSSDSEDEDSSDNFSWYKVKSKRKVPEGKSQVVIWLSQPN